jgi:hypothetical protein
MRHEYAPSSERQQYRLLPPVVGEGQEEGVPGRSTAHGPLSLALSHNGERGSKGGTRGKLVP